MASNSENEALFKAVCQLLYDGHKGYKDEDGQLQVSPTPEHCLNRLFKAHLDEHLQRFAENPPRLSSANVIVESEPWPKAGLSDVAPKGIRNRHSACPDAPLVIVSYKDRDLLIDGGSRISMWRRAGLEGSHAVYLLTVQV